MERTLNSSTLLVQVTNGKIGFLAYETRFCFSDSSPLLVQVTNGKTGFLAYETRFWFPSEESKSFSPFYYSYEVHSSNPVPDRPHLHSPTKHSRSACAAAAAQVSLSCALQPTGKPLSWHPQPGLTLLTWRLPCAFGLAARLRARMC